MRDIKCPKCNSNFVAITRGYPVFYRCGKCKYEFPFGYPNPTGYRRPLNQNSSSKEQFNTQEL